MIFREATEKELVTKVRQRIATTHTAELMVEIMRENESDKIYRVIDESHDYNNNNDFRRGIQSYIERNGLPLKVFMLNGNVFVVKENK